MAEARARGDDALGTGEDRIVSVLRCRDGLEKLHHGEILLARVVGATALPTVWGLVDRFPGSTERRWRARLDLLPDDPAAAALAMLRFHPDDAAEPLRDDVGLRSRGWSIDDEEAVIDAIEEEDLWESLGQAIPSGWAYAWTEIESVGAVDLGGWDEEPGEIEIARLVVTERDVTLVSADRDVVSELAVHIEMRLGSLVSRRTEPLFAA